MTALRVYRGGGLTKDAIYLRGLRDLLAYLSAGHDLEPLYVGKIALEHVPHGPGVASSWHRRGAGAVAAILGRTPPCANSTVAANLSLVELLENGT